METIQDFEDMLFLLNKHEVDRHRQLGQGEAEN